MPLEEGAQSSAKKAERRDMSGRTSRGEEPVAGPSSSQRQGYCSCCQVLYNSVEQHILSSQHREVVRAARANVSSGGLLERFLQDVLQYHPHRYSDTRPTHADLPLLTTPLIPKEVLSEVYCGSDDDYVSIGTREEMPTSDEESCEMLQIAASTPAVITDLTASTHVQGPSQKGKMVPEAPPSGKYSPTQGFLHRTSGSSANDQPNTSQLTLTVQRQILQTNPPGHPSASEGPPVTKTGAVEHRKAHKKTNRDKEGSDSITASRAPPAAKCITSKNQPSTFRSVAEESTVWTSALPPWKGPHREQTFSHLSDEIRDVIEEVIEKYCYGHSLNVDPQEDGSFVLSPQSMSQSKGSEEWDNAIQMALGKTKAEEKNLAELLEVHINLEDQGYQTQLDTALNTVGTPEDNKESSAEKVFPDLPHIPQSFVGKTLTQVMFEDDVKIDSIVKEFQQGQFRCYFDSESLARFGKHSKKRRKKKKQDNKEEADKAGWEPTDILPLMDHNEEDPKQSVILKKSRQRIYRLASRCQVVKVSHSTQTIPLSCPVVRRKSSQETFPSTHSEEPQQCPSPERTPDMKTRLCALKLPASYFKIMSPLQPKTVVYVLSSPDGGQGISKPTPIKKAGRKRKSCDSDVGLKYKYKKTPLKFYDPLTNRILKSPPKGMSSPSNSKSLSHVRQLFRSLSPDINKERQGLGQGQSSGDSRKARGRSSMVDLCTSTSDSILDSGGPSEPGSSLSSSRKALFTRSSISSSSCFLLGHLTASTHVDDSSKALSHSCAGSSYKVGGLDQDECRQQAAVDQTPIRRSSRRAGPLTSAKRPPVPPYRTKRKSPKPQRKAKSQGNLLQTVGSRISAECRTSPRNKSPARSSLRSSASSKLAIQPVITSSSKQINTMLSASQQKRVRGRTSTVHIAE
ncbi:DBF4-type zinc finger-containing protein 2 [Carassius auratus]|uniref:Uncharacterized protein LOC113093576 n=1 Tax=Carassius auratus TaxID=7957 RepID=A0A6P6P301_CARAU|nr:uncharacterized protein LOC113093576 [Carassius auratus]XP_026115061.1 uncharacterized protein LOC113093576 [Carassius auratus]